MYVQSFLLLFLLIPVVLHSRWSDKKNASVRKSVPSDWLNTCRVWICLQSQFPKIPVFVNRWTNLSALRPPVRRWTRVCFTCCVERPCACPPSAACCSRPPGRHTGKTRSWGCCSCRWGFSFFLSKGKKKVKLISKLETKSEKSYLSEVEETAGHQTSWSISFYPLTIACNWFTLRFASSERMKTLAAVWFQFTD